LGADVSVFMRHDRPLRTFDHTISEHLGEEMEAQGVNMVKFCKAKRVVSRLVLPKEKIHEQLTSAATVNHNEFHLELEPIDGQTVQVPASSGPFNAIVVAIGRHPNLETIGLDAAGVELGPYGFIKTDEWQQTSTPNVYAVGDVCGPLLLTPGAFCEQNALIF
jgi:glutathione reductase (NADPH)